MTLSTRELRLSDYPQACALWARMDGLGDTPREPAFAAFLSRNGDFCRACEADGKFIGALLASFDGIRGYFYRLAVDEAHRRHGIAARLVREAEARLRAAGADRINLHVFESNVTARKFWQAQDWRAHEGLLMMRKTFGGGKAC